MSSTRGEYRMRIYQTTRLSFGLCVWLSDCIQMVCVGCYVFWLVFVWPAFAQVSTRSWPVLGRMIDPRVHHVASSGIGLWGPRASQGEFDEQAWGRAWGGVCVGACFPPALPRPDAEDDGAEVAPDGTASDTDSSIVGCLKDEDCSGLDRACAVGRCETGQCVVHDASGTCDDGNKCTTGDRCEGGACVGTAVVCAPASDCHLGGVCDGATGHCSNPPRPDGAICDDGNFCTTGDRCGSGFCFGPGQPESSDFIVGIEADGSAVVTALASDVRGRATVVVASRAKQLVLTGASSAGVQNTTEERCSVRLLRFSQSAVLDATTSLFDRDCASSTPPRIGSIVTPGDATSIVAGRYDGPFTTAHGWGLGASPTGLLVEEGVFIARVKDDGERLWSFDLLGFSEAGDFDRSPRLSAGPGGAVATMIGNGRAGIRQIVDEDGVLIQESVEEARKVSLGLVWGPNGDLRRTVRVESEGAILGTAAVLGPDGTLYLLGMTQAEATLISDQGQVTTIPTGIHSEYSAWVVALDASGNAKWWRHVFVPPAAGLNPWDLQVTPFELKVLDDRVLLMLGATRLPSIRADSGPGTFLFETNAAYQSISILVELSANNGAVQRVHKWNGGPVLAVGLEADSLGEIVFGLAGGLVEGDSVPVGSAGQPAFFLTRPSQWIHQASFGADYADDDRAFTGLHLASDGSRGVFAAGLVEGRVDLGIDTRHGVGARGYGFFGFLMRLGSHGRFDCR